ncbi:MAG: LuxQ periplasmic sensor domain-containing protein [Campylobacterota bacterium]|nr:LuxQ periplasmic sensor domain-containing protein [Campylobacterota bacterium]
MKTSNKLIKFNVYFIVIFFVILSVLTYFLFKNISYLHDEKLQERFSTKINAAQVIYDNISYKIDANLNKFKNADKLVELIKEKKESEVINFILKDIDTIIDMACVYTKDKVCIIKNDSGKDVFDALQKVKRKFQKEFFVVNVKGKNYYMMRSNIKIVDKHLGKVVAVLCFSVVLNDNSSLIQELKDRLDINELFLVSNEDMIVGSKKIDEKLQKDIISLKEKEYTYKGKFVISKYKLNKNKFFSLVMFLENYEHDVINERIIILFMTVIVIIFIAFLILYLMLRKYIKKLYNKRR